MEIWISRNKVRYLFHNNVHVDIHMYINDLIYLFEMTN